MIRFLCELFRRAEYPPEKAIAAVANLDPKGRKVSKISTIPHPISGYWLDWGGTYDTPETNIIALYFDIFLALTDSIAQMILTGSSLYRDTDLVYFATDLYPWQYPENQTELSFTEGYSTSVPDSSEPSNDILDERSYPVRMAIPSLEIAIPDAISGSALQLSTFNVSLDNADGHFDLTENNNFFNSPIYVLKSFVDNPSYTDFNIIRRGFIDALPTSFDKLTITAATIFRSLSQEMTKTITVAKYPLAGDNLDKQIPIGYGYLLNVDVIEVNAGTYLLIDPDYITDITAVYDSDNVLISSSNYSLVDGLLVMTAGTPSTADIIGSISNDIGTIIVDAMQNTGGVLYNSPIWDTVETDSYIASAPDINLLFDDGSVRDLIAEVLKSDNAFLIEKSNGSLSLRKWGNTYDTHYIENWTITQKPEKSFVNSKYFVTTARVEYSNSGVYENSASEATIAEIYRKKQTITYETALSSETEANNLSTAMISRYGQRSEVWKVSLGINTNNISLLDKVRLDLIVNDRKLSIKNEFLVKAVDVAQDVLTLEALGTVKIVDGILATPLSIEEPGDLSGAYFTSSDALLPEKIRREDS